MSWDGPYGSCISVYILTCFFKHWVEKTSSMCILPLCFLRPLDISRATGRDTAFFKGMFGTHTLTGQKWCFWFCCWKNVKWCILCWEISRPELYARFTASPAMKWKQIYLGTHCLATAEQVFPAASSCQLVSTLWQKSDFFYFIFFNLAWSYSRFCVFWCEFLKQVRKKITLLHCWLSWWSI